MSGARGTWAVRLWTALLAVLVSPLVAGLFGALHDQVSYTLAPEYFTHLKFDQFQIPEVLHGRVGVALVGVYATWWVGPPIGLGLAPLLGLRRPAAERPWRNAPKLVIGAFAVVMTVAALGSAAGFVYGVAASDVLLAGYTPPTGVTDPVAFVRVGAMHSGAYAGGAAGFLVAAVVQVTVLWRGRR